MALTSPTAYMNCPSCGFAGKFPFEHIVVSRLGLPKSNLDLQRKDIAILEELDLFQCRQCQYVLGLDNTDPLQMKAIEKGKEIKGIKPKYVEKLKEPITVPDSMSELLGETNIKVTPPAHFLSLSEEYGGFPSVDSAIKKPEIEEVKRPRGRPKLFGK